MPPISAQSRAHRVLRMEMLQPKKKISSLPARSQWESIGYLLSVMLRGSV